MTSIIHSKDYPALVELQSLAAQLRVMGTTALVQTIDRDVQGLIRQTTKSLVTPAYVFDRASRIINGLRSRSADEQALMVAICADLADAGLRHDRRLASVGTDLRQRLASLGVSWRA